jgi:hypothetical protein
VDKLNQTVSDLSVAYPSMEVKLKDTRPDVMPNDQIEITRVTYDYNDYVQGTTTIINKTTNKTLSIENNNGVFGGLVQYIYGNSVGEITIDTTEGRAENAAEKPNAKPYMGDETTDTSGFSGVGEAMETQSTVIDSLKVESVTMDGTQYVGQQTTLSTEQKKIAGKEKEDNKIKENQNLSRMAGAGNGNSNGQYDPYAN